MVLVVVVVIVIVMVVVVSPIGHRERRKVSLTFLHTLYGRIKLKLGWSMRHRSAEDVFSDSKIIVFFVFFYYCSN